MGIPLVKTNKLFFPTSFGRGCSQGISQICDLHVLKDIWRHFTTDVSYFRPYAETKNNEGEQRVCMKWIQFRSWFRPTGAKVYIYIYMYIYIYQNLILNVVILISIYCPTIKLTIDIPFNTFRIIA